MNDDKESKNLADMTEEEIKDNLLFDSYFIHENGPMCKCWLARLTHFHASLPDHLCGKQIDDDTEIGEPFETTGSSVCACQDPYWFKMKFGPNGVEFEETEGEVMDSRKLRLPNFREY